MYIIFIMLIMFLMIKSIRVRIVLDCWLFMNVSIIDVFILRLALLLYVLIHSIALLPVDTTELSFTSDSSV